MAHPLWCVDGSQAAIRESRTEWNLGIHFTYVAAKPHVPGRAQKAHDSRPLCTHVHRYLLGASCATPYLSSEYAFCESS